MNNGIDLYNKIDELADKIDNVLSEYGLQIGTLYGQFKNPVELTIHVEEVEGEEE